MIENKWWHRILKWAFKQLGWIETHEVTKEEMCKSAQSMCTHKCISCAWYHGEVIEP